MEINKRLFSIVDQTTIYFGMPCRLYHVTTLKPITLQCDLFDRFRHGYCKHNPRKMVKTWAEKEMRNLTRMHSAGIPCPEPIVLRSHVLVMDFIGHKGWPAPLLKDCRISDSKARELYLQCVKLIRDLYWKCKLVHADLSEFNMLYNQVSDELFVIDVSQSVEHDHPNSLVFLRKDCSNINDFFKKKNVCTMTVKELFEFATDPTVTDENIDDYLEKAQERAASRDESELEKQNVVDEEVFKSAYIPRTLDEVVDFEADSQKVKQGTAEDIFYPIVTGLKQDLTGAKECPDILEGKMSNEPEASSGESSDEDTGDDADEGTKKDSSQSEEPILSRKEHKKLIKEQNRERRKHKVPKAVKKRKEKLAKVRKGKK